jgi:glyoxalase/bleomycin resistance protein/dioxygenase superfamily protein
METGMKPVVLYRNHFQLGYVIRNLEGAMQTMRDRFGVKEWQVNHLPPSAPGRALAFAYVDTIMIELVDIRPEEDTIYRDWIPATDDGLRLHHLGYLIEDDEEWQATIRQFEDAGFAPALVGGAPNLMEWYYADTVATLGHYSELIRFKSEAGRAYWANVPHN